MIKAAFKGLNNEKRKFQNQDVSVSQVKQAFSKKKRKNMGENKVKLIILLNI